MMNICTFDPFALVEILDYSIYDDLEIEMLARALRAAVVENIRKQGLITDEEAEQVLAGPLKGV